MMKITFIDSLGYSPDEIVELEWFQVHGNKITSPEGITIAVYDNLLDAWVCNEHDYTSIMVGP